MCLSFGTPTICCGVVRSAENGGLEFSWYLAQMMSSHPQGALTGQSSRADADHVLMCSLLCRALSSCVVTGRLAKDAFCISNYTASWFKIFTDL